MAIRLVLCAARARLGLRLGAFPYGGYRVSPALRWGERANGRVSSARRSLPSLGLERERWYSLYDRETGITRLYLKSQDERKHSNRYGKGVGTHGYGTIQGRLERPQGAIARGHS